MNHEQVIVTVFNKHSRRNVYDQVVRVNEWSKEGLVEWMGREKELKKVLGEGLEVVMEKVEGNEGCGWKTMWLDGKELRVSMIGRNN